MPGFRRALTLLVTGTAITLGAALAPPVATASEPTPAPPPATAPDASTPAPTPTEVNALEAAKSSGKAVEVAEKTTETSTVLANPDGTFTLHSHPQPVRVKQNGAWRDVDTTLTKRPDGGLAPVAAAIDVVFSGGGSTPMVTMTEADKSLSLAWPTPLPEPVLDGSTATYPDVLPGVDLRVTAGTIGYSQVLVVKDAKAAADPALRALKFTAVGKGVALDRSSKSLSAKDSHGNPVFSGSTPVMWDSTRDDKVGPAPSATEPGSGKLSALELSTREVDGPASVELTVVPDPKALTGPDVRYPLYIDPVMSRNKESWLEVTDEDWQYYNATMDAQVGNCGNWTGCDGNWVARSFFKFVTPDLQSRNGRKATLWSAWMVALQTHGTSCTAESTTVYQVAPFYSNTRWPGPNGHAIDSKSSNAGDQCGGARDVVFNVGRSAQEVIDVNAGDLHMGLLAPDEGNKFQWKKFGNNPRLEVTFSFPPNAPYDLSVGNAFDCGNGLITPDAFPTLYSRATDNNASPMNLALYTEIWDTAHTANKAKTTTPPEIASGSLGSWQSDVDLGNGTYDFKVTAHNIFPGDGTKNLWAGVWSPWLRFTTRSVPITQVPTITSGDYPQGYWGKPQNQPGTFTFTALGTSNLAGFTYSFNGSGTQVAPTNSDCAYDRTFGTDGGWVTAAGGRGTITVPPTLSPGYHTLHVRSFDDAHKLSPESQAYAFYVAPSYVTPAPTQRIEGETLALSGIGSGQLSATPADDPLVSGGKYLKLVANTDGATGKIAFTVPATGDYDLTAGMVSNKNMPDQVRFTLDGRELAGYYSGGTQTTTRTYDLPLAGMRLSAGQHVLGVKLNMKWDSTATMFLAGLDYLHLSPTVKLDAEVLPEVSTDKPLVRWGGCCNMPVKSNSYLYFDGDGVGQSFSLKVTTPIEADYAIGAGFAKSPSYGTWSVGVDGSPLGTTSVDGYSDTFTAGFAPLGGVHLTAGEHVVTFTTTGTNPNSTDIRYRIGIDYLTLIPVNNVTTASFADAMNNKGISSDGTTTAVLDYFGASLSAQTLAAAGLAPGNKVTISGATFTMPAANAAGNDNVVAIGQTIPFPAEQQVKANAVGLIVTSTCGKTLPRTGTITYTDGTTSNPLFPEAAEWTWLPDDPIGIKLPYRNAGLSKQTNYHPVLYPVFVPADPTKTVKSITLPNYGTGFLAGTCDPAPALHVFAMAPRPVGAGWVGAWAAPADNAVVVPNGFADRTLRTVLKPTVTGAQVRVKFANTVSSTPATIDAATVAAQSGTGATTTGTPVPLKFGGAASVTIPAGGEVYSDPVAMPTGGNLVVSLHLPTAVPQAPVHGEANAPTYLASGNVVGNVDGAPFTTTLNGSYYVSAVDVSTADPGHGTVVVLGDQLTAQAPPGPAQRNTWVDNLPGKLAASGGTLPGGLINASRAGIPDTGRWRMTDGSGTTARDFTGGANATAAGGVTWSTDHNGSAVLDGSTGHFQTASKVLDTGRSFSVSAWVKVNDLSRSYTAVAQDGGSVSSFALQYYQPHRRWSFTVVRSDSTVVAPTLTSSSTLAEIGRWTHLVGTYDATTRTTRLYVDGVHQVAASNVTVFPGNGPLTIGRRKSNGQPAEYLNGAIADVRVHQRALAPLDAQWSFWQKDWNAFPNTGSVGAGNIKLEVDRSVLSAPGVRTVLLAAGANTVLRGGTAAEARAGLELLIKAGSPTGMKRQLRPDGTPVHVILTTVPPLGLDGADPREVQRRQLNSDMMAHFADYGADYVVDFDAAVRSGADPGKVAPEYLTGGVANGAYHDRIAQFLADAINDFPPRAEL
ncbi:LamG-like jellyroll fold domain-containing protein [Actinosynnema sp. NPDC050801]|uniref:LamG-like jellyroll fold domain-containing protein n=1 Tax=unclassified Actinosynnema TaxID=2637065 RepID=UPI0033E88010